MILLMFAAIGISLGLYRGGSFRNIADGTVRFLPLPIFALLLEVWLPFLLTTLNLSGFWVKPLPLVAEYGMLLFFSAANIRSFWSGWFGVGTLFNFAVMALNGWAMPVSQGIVSGAAGSGIVQRLAAGEISGYVLADAGTRLLFLGDVIGIHLGANLLGFASIGDYLLGIGVAGLAFRLVCPRYSGKRLERGPAF
ncbi:DUF5317 family protein [Papillibacter cinnamivorans]|uniref:Uncharacterized protein n=1 Tax=Papillibacter cinnamivorans DSM 12816 TaxID=1122930 RepID=A0A1W2A0M5_9FIRM|nr:DUF5317 family protein [Papillibacter cinnamivorans]SMC54200.1 hypothetical protein SAMN02745168_1374 [Papillibacter cinnamivorans DSM 12816]